MAEAGAAPRGAGPRRSAGRAPAAVEFHLQPNGQLSGLLKQLGASLVSRRTRPTSCWSPGPGGRAVDAGAHVRAAYGPGGDAHRLTIGTRNQIWSCARPDIARASSRPTARRLPSCRAPLTSRNIGVTNSPGAATKLWRSIRDLLPVYAARRHSFVPRWRRRSSRLCREDRCHLNGLEIVDAGPSTSPPWARTTPPAVGGPTSPAAAVAGCE